MEFQDLVSVWKTILRVSVSKATAKSTNFWSLSLDYQVSSLGIFDEVSVSKF